MRYFILFLFVFSASCTRGKSAPAENALRLKIDADFPNMNWLTEADYYQQQAMAVVYEPLLGNDPHTFEFTPGLAKSYEVSKDKMSFTFELDERAKWFDGQPVTAADVQFTFDVVFDPKMNTGPLKAVYGSLDPKIQIINERKFVIKTKNLHFRNLELAGGLPIIPKHLLQGKDLNKEGIMDQTVGSGPYQLEKWEKGDRIIFKKNPNYWAKDLPSNKGLYNTDRIIYKIVREPKVAMEMLKSNFWSAFTLDSEQWEQVVNKRRDDGMKDVIEDKEDKIKNSYDMQSYANKRPMGYSFIGWNLRNDLFKSRNIREALSLLLNREWIIEKITYNHQKPSIGPLESASDYAPKDIEPYKYNPSKALELLAKEGWTDSNKDGVLDRNGKKFEFTLLFVNPKSERFLTVYKEDLQKAGIICNLKKLDWNLFTKLLDERKFEAVILAWSASVNPDLEQIWHSDSMKGNGSNFVGYSNPTVDKLIKDAQKEFDKTKRIEINRKFAKIIYEDFPYTWFLERPKKFKAYDKRWKRSVDYFNYETNELAGEQSSLHMWSLPN